jgi:hypothetical protein
MVRRFLSLEGEVMAEEHWNLKPTDRCFYCDGILLAVQDRPCTAIFGGVHDFVTLVNPVH